MSLNHGLQVERCLAQACTPLLEMVCCWLFEGRLSSAAGDFFIISNPLPNGTAHLHVYLERKKLP